MKARVTCLLLAWLGAFLIVTALFLALGSLLTERPLAVRALIVCGVLVVTMTQVVLPLIRRLLGPPEPPAERDSPIPGARSAGGDS